jgi:arylsulfatase
MRFQKNLRLRCLVLSLFLLSILSCAGDRRQQPNIILIMADDMGYSDLGCYGSEITTPNIDQLAENGLRFTQFYNAARCCPTRASLLTGLYPHQAGMGDMVNSRGRGGAYQGYLNKNCLTLAELLRTAGYRTAMSGKWHVGEKEPHWPVKRGFEKYFGLISGAANYFDISKAKNDTAVRRMAIDDQEYTPPKEGFYMTTAITDNAVSFLDSFGSGQEPFFLYVAYTAPHWPLHALPEDIERFLGRYTMGWEELRRSRYARMVDLGIIDPSWKLSPLDPEAVSWDSVEDKDLMDRKMAVYAAQIFRLDAGVGRIMQKIRELSVEENTLVLFLADNGACHEGGALGFDNRENGVPVGGVESYMSYGRSWSNAGNTPFRMHKHWTHEGGIATPLIAYWPGMIRRPGSLSPEIGHIVDVMATLVDVSGAQYPIQYQGNSIHPMEGRSLFPLFQGQQREPHEFLFWEHEGSEAVRNGKWKLVAAEGGSWELYDMEADRTELNDLSDQYPEEKSRLIQAWEEWADRVEVLRR